MIHLVLILGGKILFDTMPFVSQEASWTLVNLAYMLVSRSVVSFPLNPPAHPASQLTFLMFHWVTGIPFSPDAHGGAYDDLTLWEQIDEGAQYTPSKKWLFSLPIGLFVHGR
jgi:hypothetical protein